jgi:16S rRNA (guanine966-N2)-methyltransferase
MRVISGTLGGRKFYPEKLSATRPTTDFAKTALFNILNNNFDFEEIRFLDLFSGTGSISYEFASRGCKQIVAIDKDERCIEFIRKMIGEWKIETIHPIRSDVFRFLDHANEKFDIIFAGPPYPLENIEEIPLKIFEKNILNKEGWFILETDPHYNFEKHPFFFRRTHYGQTNFHFFKLT